MAKQTHILSVSAATTAAGLPVSVQVGARTNADGDLDAYVALVASSASVDLSLCRATLCVLTRTGVRATQAVGFGGGCILITPAPGQVYTVCADIQHGSAAYDTHQLDALFGLDPSGTQTDLLLLDDTPGPWRLSRTPSGTVTLDPIGHLYHIDPATQVTTRITAQQLQRDGVTLRPPVPDMALRGAILASYPYHDSIVYEHATFATRTWTLPATQLAWVLTYDSHPVASGVQALSESAADALRNEVIPLLGADETAQGDIVTTTDSGSATWGDLRVEAYA